MPVENRARTIAGTARRMSSSAVRRAPARSRGAARRWTLRTAIFMLMSGVVLLVVYSTKRGPKIVGNFVARVEHSAMAMEHRVEGAAGAMIHRTAAQFNPDPSSVQPLQTLDLVQELAGLKRASDAAEKVLQDSARSLRGVQLKAFHGEGSNKHRAHHGHGKGGDSLPGFAPPRHHDSLAEKHGAAGAGAAAVILRSSGDGALKVAVKPAMAASKTTRQGCVAKETECPEDWPVLEKAVPGGNGGDVCRARLPNKWHWRCPLHCVKVEGPWYCVEFGT